jgi:predicted Zn-ribbon and HTH transcriptional regulator
MEESKKKPVMVGVIVACLALAGVVTYIRYSGSSGGGVEAIPASEMMWVKCSNKACSAEYQISKRDYFQYMKEHTNPMSSAAPMVCQKCGKESVYAAVKCLQCGTVFFENSVPGDFPDRCPKCGRSETEETRKKRLAERGG